MDSATGKVIVNYACFVINSTQYCLKGTLSRDHITPADPSDWAANKGIMEKLRNAGAITCSRLDDDLADCSGSGFISLKVENTGYARVGVGDSPYSCSNCYTYYWGRSDCAEQ